jgi:kumamolisin
VGGHVITPDKGANGEVALDTIAAGETAPDMEQTLLFGDNDDAGIARIQNEAAFPTNPARRPADLVSWSWGQYIEGWTQQSLRTTSNAMKRSALKGITTFAAAGDDGAPDRAPGGKPTVDYPAADPFVVGVGGTQIIMTPGGQVVKETSWNDGPNSATGGGMDRFFSTRPDFQAKIKTPPDATGSTFNGRWVPDISEVASPRSGLIVRVDGKKGVIGGTSWAAPQAGAEIGTISAKLGRNFGHMNPFFYENGTTGIFNDITEGDNNGYKSTKGWDPVTGWGTPKVQEMMAALDRDGKHQPSFVGRVSRSLIPRSQQTELGIAPNWNQLHSLVGK